METKKLNWSKGNGLLPAIIQDFNSKDILMLGFMNEEALERTLSENKVTFLVELKINYGVKEILQVIRYALKISL